MNVEEVIRWLLQGDVSVQYQVHRDLLLNHRKNLQLRIGREGWGASFLSQRKKNGHWGREFYYPKWTATHYTLLDLRNLGISPENLRIQESIDTVLKNGKAVDGGIRLLRAKQSDVCVNGMFLNYAAYFKADAKGLRSVVDCLLKEHMPDGGFNCRSNRSGAVHSSMHSTISVLEGFAEYRKNDYVYRLEEVEKAMGASQEFLLEHRLYLSDKTGKIIDHRFLRLSYPSRWRYDILRALDYFQYTKATWDDRMEPAMDVLLGKRNKDNTWNVQAKIPGQTHFEMEKAGKPSRWNTLRALRVLRHFQMEDRRI